MDQPPQEACNFCASLGHSMSECPTAAQFLSFIQEQVQAAQGIPKPSFDPYSNTYNPEWKQHPNFSWKGQSSQAPFASSTQYVPKPPVNNQFYPSQFKNQGSYQAQPFNNQPTYQQPLPRPDPKEKRFNQIQQLIQAQQQSFQQTLQQTLLAQQQAFQQTIQAQQQSISRLETQLGQIAESSIRREPGQLPSQPVANPRNHPPGFQPQMGLLPQPMQIAQPPQPPQNIPPLQKGPHMENIKAITTLRSGKTLEDPYKTQEPIEKSCNQNEEAKEIENTISNKVL